MTRSYLPLNSLRAFEAAARHLSFTRAAIELVTHSAISQHVKTLRNILTVSCSFACRAASSSPPPKEKACRYSMSRLKGLLGCQTDSPVTVRRRSSRSA